MTPERRISDVACTVCGCVCDDLAVTVQEGRIVAAAGACELAEPWLLRQDEIQPPGARIRGRAAAFADAVDEAAGLLAAARYPLVFGLSRSTTAGQRAAIRLADALGANIDTTASLCHASSIMAIQQVGEPTCTLGEIKNRADLVIYWGVDPIRTHPRHMERYAVEPAGLFVPRGRADRRLVVVDGQANETGRLSDLFVRIAAGRDLEALWTLRALVRDQPPEAGRLLGAELDDLKQLAALMKSCRCGVVFFGLGLARTGLGHANVEALLRLVIELNAETRFYARRMRILGDVAGADSVLCWQTGFPFSVNLSRGYPRYNPQEYSANELLERGEVDACLLVGSEGVLAMSPRAISHLERIPTIALDSPTVESAVSPAIRLTTAVPGVHLPGTAYRMDEVPIPLRPLLPRRYPSDAEVLDAIRGALRRLGRA